jgi:regulator of cell morphogenesis and NO signaling
MMKGIADPPVTDRGAREAATIYAVEPIRTDFDRGPITLVGGAPPRHGPDASLAELPAGQPGVDEPTIRLENGTLRDLIQHIQHRYHFPLRSQLPRLAQMLATLINRGGDRVLGTLLPLQAIFDPLQRGLLDRMAREDRLLFPAIEAAEAFANDVDGPEPWRWIEQPIDVIEAEHASRASALVEMRELTRGFALPEDACPTLRNLYFVLAEFERGMYVHMHLENNVLFPRAVRLVRRNVRTDLPQITPSTREVAREETASPNPALAAA